MMNWKRKDFADRLGLGTEEIQAYDGYAVPAIIARADVDPLTRGMLAAVSTSMLDGYGGVENYQLKYWYRRQNGQSNLIHLFEIESTLDEQTDEIHIEEIYYRNKPLIGNLPLHSQIRPREIILDAIREVNTHLREGGSPKEISKILHAFGVQQVIGEDITLPGQNTEGNFSFKIADVFNPAAKGKISAGTDNNLMQAIIHGEVNTIDKHRRIDSEQRQAFATNKTTGVTFRGEFAQKQSASTSEMSIALEPSMSDGDVNARRMDDFLKVNWKKSMGEEGPTYGIQGFKFLNTDISSMETDTQIRALGATYKIMDLFRRRRYPMALDIMHEFDLLNLFTPVAPPPAEGRFSVVSYLGNGKEEIVEGFGFDLGACKAVSYEKLDENGQIKRETIILDLGKMLSPKGSEWDGGLPDVVGILKDVDAIFITHRHLDHMASIIELTRLGLLKDKKILGASRVLYILQNQLRAEVDNKQLMPEFETIEGEGIHHFKNISVEYCVDGMDHSTPSTIYRVVGRTDEGVVKGSYLFYGDGRHIDREEFLQRGLRSFGIERQDTLHDLDLTNAKKIGKCPTNKEASENRVDAWKCFPNHGIINAEISTNDRKLQELYRGFNRVQRNFTAVGHNIEMSVRAHNIHGVDPEFIEHHEKDNVNRFLKKDAEEETQRRTSALAAQLENETSSEKRAELQDKIDELRLRPVEFRSRGSAKAKEWLQGDPGKLGILVTGTQGNPGEMFSTLYRFAEGWSTLDNDRNTAYKISDAKKWVVWIDQSAIPGNHKHQKNMIDKLLRNRGVHAVGAAIDDGFKLYGLDQAEQAAFKAQYLGKNNRSSYTDETGALVITGAPIHPSGHGYMEDIRHIAATAKADLNHGTHTNDPENTTRFHLDICDKLGLRHVGRQFDDFEHNEIDMGNSPEEARVTSLGHSHSSMILFKVVREFGKFFGGTLRAKRVTKLDGDSGYAEYGLFGGSSDQTFESAVVAVDFASASRQRKHNPDDKTDPDDNAMSEPLYERRYKGANLPRGVRLDERKRNQIKEFAARMVA